MADKPIPKVAAPQSGFAVNKDGTWHPDAARYLAQLTDALNNALDRIHALENP